ncbi:MAG: hypothetical protein MUF15_06000 [Acidobacteria bacterium]|nr:hypothetical protein [Acidobacteriota bacterium]
MGPENFSHQYEFSLPVNQKLKVAKYLKLEYNISHEKRTLWIAYQPAFSISRGYQSEVW